MSYVPGSHKFGHVQEKAIYEKNSLSTRWHLKDFKKILKDNLDFFHNSFEPEAIKKFFKDTDGLDNDDKNLNKTYFAILQKQVVQLFLMREVFIKVQTKA